MPQAKAKNLVIVLTELIALGLMVWGILPREAALWITGLLIFYFIFSPLEDSLWVFIASIPLFVALPLKENFDSMANWRILLSVLFLVWLVKERKRLTDWLNPKSWGALGYWLALFLLTGFWSLWPADYFWIGLKKILFLVNIFLLFFLVKEVALKNKLKIISAAKTAVGLTLAVGFVQLLMVFLRPLYVFWQFWAGSIIPIFYGKNLSQLLFQSNTWFSYSSYLPSLRMFSVFPDSHSFAFFVISALPLFLTAIFWRPPQEQARWFNRPLVLYLLLAVSLLAILFSGSRGAWVSALGVFFAFLLLILFYYSPTIRAWSDLFIPKALKQWRQQLGLIFGSLIMFFLLLPISSGIIFLSQKAQTKGEIDLEKISFFERAKSITDFSELSAKTRLEIWERTVNSIIKNPLWGVGLGNYPIILDEEISSAKKGASAHNLYLDIAAETGLIGLLALLAVFWCIFKKAWRVFLKNQAGYFQAWAGFFTFALIWILGYSLFDVVLLNDKVLLFFMVNLGLLYSINNQ